MHYRCGTHMKILSLPENPTLIHRTFREFLGCFIFMLWLTVGYICWKDYHENLLDLIHKEVNIHKKHRFLVYLGEDCALALPDWYCMVASNTDSAMTTLCSIWASEAIAFSYFSCAHNFIVNQYSCVVQRQKVTYYAEFLVLQRCWQGEKNGTTSSIKVPAYLII